LPIDTAEKTPLTQDIFQISTGQSPLVISFPHAGTEIPDELAERLTPEALRLVDTDWFVDRLYQSAEARQATRLVARLSRYVIDLNRPPDGSNLYPGQPTPELCPLSTFDGADIYRPACQPSAEEVARRIEAYWRPYHTALVSELRRVRDRWGVAVLLDGHTIKSRVPRLFSGTLPDINVGTARGTSCDESLREAVADCLAEQGRISVVIDGRFVGGYITRHYGRPADNIHAVQLELSQATYLDETTGNWDEGRARAVMPVLDAVVDCCARWLAKRHNQ
jgi:N-formylglutamate amidohydrolase